MIKTVWVKDWFGVKFSRSDTDGEWSISGTPVQFSFIFSKGVWDTMPPHIMITMGKRQYAFFFNDNKYRPPS